MMDKRIEKARIEFEIGEADKSLLIVDDILSDNDMQIDALIIKAQIYYKLQKWGDALNILNRVLDIDKNNKTALSLKQMTMSIVTFWNKDNYNP